MKRIEIKENNLNMVYEITDENEIKLLHFSNLPFDENDINSCEGTASFRPVEVLLSGLNRPGERHGTKYTYTAPGYRLKYKDMKDYRNETGRKLEILMEDKPTGLEVCSNIQFYDGISVIRSWTELKNNGEEDLGVEYVSSFALLGIDKEGLLSTDEKLEVLIARNAWQKELIWNRFSMDQLGMSISQPDKVRRSSQTISVGNTGNWSTKNYLPMGCLKNKETDSILFWQIEQNGSWYWEISDQDGHMYLQLSGPTEHQSHWWKNLKPGDTFASVPVSVGSACGDVEEAAGELTKYRRAIRRKNEDNEKLPVIFNDYMNCLWGDPTTEKELPLIDKAKEAGCEYFCVADDWYFMRHGKKVYDRSRYQLDFRNPEVIAHATEVIDRLVNEYGVGYIKMDYNIEPGIGTELNADSAGDGLLGHNRAYLKWLDGIFVKYPNLVIENCSSGGLRMDYAMLSRYSIQSTSDQEDYIRYATIAANSPMALTPEQAAIWSYPLTEGDKEEVIFNMVNAILLRIHQSGHLVNLSPERFDLVKEAISYYKTIRVDIKNAVPFWPLGLSKYRDPWVSMGLNAGKKDYVAVWRRNSQTAFATIPVEHRKGQDLKVVCGYPKAEPCNYKWNKEAGELTVEFPNPVSARLFCLEEV